MRVTKDEASKEIAQSARAYTCAEGICEVSGIAFNFPGLPKPEGGSVLVVASPLRQWANVQGYAAHSSAWLEKQSSSFLAGLLVAGYKKWGLLQAGPEASSVELNSVISRASVPVLVQLVRWMRSYTEKTTAGLPALVVCWSDVRDERFNSTQFLQAYALRLKPYFDQEHKEAIRVAEIRSAQTHTAMDNALHRMGRTLAGGQYLSAKQTYARHEKEFEETLKHAKGLLRNTLKDAMPWASEGMRNMLHTLSLGRNLVACNMELRKQLADKLEAMQQGALAEALRSTHNPYDIFVKAEAELDRASDEWYPQAEGQERNDANTASSISQPNLVASTSQANQTTTSIRDLIAKRKQTATPDAPTDF